MAKGDLIGGSGLPVGTPAEITALGESLDKWGCCAPRGENLKSRGCNHFPECIFPFKGHKADDGGGPRNAVVYIRSDTGASVERVMPCHVFMETLYKRSMAEGSGETIAVVGGEGDEYERVAEESVTRHSKTDMRMKRETKKAVCPPFPRPGEAGSAMGPEFLSRQKIDARLKDKARVLRQLQQQGIDPAELLATHKEQKKSEKASAATPAKRD